MNTQLNFGQYRHLLWTTSTFNFIDQQPDRFMLLEGAPCITGTMFFCRTYLEAHFVMSLEEGVALYSDEYNWGGEDSFVVCSKKPFSTQTLCNAS